MSGGENINQTMVNNSAVKIMDEKNANSVVEVKSSCKGQRNNTNLLNSKVNNSIELARSLIDFTSI